MRTFYRIFISALILLQSGYAYSITTGSQTVTRGNNYDKTTLLVQFNENVADADIANVANAVGASSRSFRGANKLRSTAIKRWRIFTLPANANLAQVRKALSNRNNVSRVEFNYVHSIEQTPNDPDFSLLWGLNNTGQSGGTANADIDAPLAWDISTGSSSTIVAVIDTGVYYTHEDLAANIWTNPGEIPGNGIDDDNNGFIDDVHGYDFVNNDGDPLDDHGHGTHVSGTIAAVGNNGIGVVGVNWQARIMGLKFLDSSGFGNTDAAVEALIYATNMGAKISNNSWGGGPFSQVLLDAITAANEAGHLFIAAAGNDYGKNNDVNPTYPASYDAPNIIAVAATDHNDLLAAFSNFGATTVDLGAPGVSIYSTEPPYGNACCSNVLGYGYLNGTSMATPHVSGAAALLLSVYPTDSNSQIKQRILAAAHPIASLSGKTLTGGRLNVYNALENDTTPPSAVSDLSATGVGAFSALLAWTASGDDGNAGVASSYDIRYSTSPINDANFDSAIAVIGPSPAPSGVAETLTVKGLLASTDYYFAIKVLDNVGNVSALSNIAMTTTMAAQSIYYENFETGLTNWTISGSDGVGGPALWHISAHRYNSPVNALYYGLEGSLTYNTGAANSGSALSNPIDLTQAPADSKLQFSYYLRTENLSPYDTASVSITTDAGASWSQIWSSATDSIGMTMVPVDIDLAPYVGSVIQLEFSFNTGDGIFNDFEGWVVDDIYILTSVTNPGNLPPIASAGGPYSVTLGDPIFFDGSGSYDPEGQPLTYAWDFGDGSIGGGVSPSHTYATIGTYTVTLKVNDGVYDSAPSSTSVTISPPVNLPPVANPGGPYAAQPDQAIIFDGSGSSDPEGQPLSYQWSFGDGSSGTGVNPTHTYTASGTYTVTLVVNDGTYDSDPATTTATINQAPSANAGGPYTGTVNEAIVFDGSGSSDLEGQPLTYAWNFGDGSSGSGVNPSHTYAAIGVYTITLVVNDGTYDSDPASTSVTINPPPANLPPVANAGVDQTVSRKTLVTLDASLSSDPEGSALSYAWQQIEGIPSVTLVNADTVQATFIAPNVGAKPKVFVFAVTVTDDQGLTATDQVSITVTK